MNNDTIFKSTIHITTVMETEILPLEVRLKIGLGFDDTNPYHQAIALERIRYMINVVFQDTIFGNRKNPLIYQLKELTSTRIAECWDEPYDQFIAIMVYYKVSAILEGVGYVDSINISGDTINEDLEYSYYSEMLTSDVLEEDVEWMKSKEIESLWYHRSDTSINEGEDSSELDWNTLGLSWDKPEKKDGKVHSFKNNIKKFTPRIIK